MDYINSSGLRASIIAVAAVALTVLSALPFESSHSASSQRTQPRSGQIPLSAPAADHTLRNA